MEIGRKDDEELEGQTVEFSMLLNVAVNADSVPWLLLEQDHNPELESQKEGSTGVPPLLSVRERREKER